MSLASISSACLRRSAGAALLCFCFAVAILPCCTHSLRPCHCAPRLSLLPSLSCLTLVRLHSTPAALSPLPCRLDSATPAALSCHSCTPPRAIMLRHSTSRRRQCTLLCTALIAVSLALLRPVLAASAAAFPSPFAAAALDADVVLAETTISSDGSAHLFSFPPGSTPPPHRTLDDVLAHAREAYAAGLLRVPKADGSGLADPAVDALPPVPNAWDPRNNSYWTRTCSNETHRRNAE